MNQRHKFVVAELAPVNQFIPVLISQIRDTVLTEHFKGFVTPPLIIREAHLFRVPQGLPSNGTCKSKANPYSNRQRNGSL